MRVVEFKKLMGLKEREVTHLNYALRQELTLKDNQLLLRVEAKSR